MNVTLRLKKAVITAAAVGLAAAVLIFSAEIRQGVVKGLSLSAYSVIPSLFLFTAAALFIVKSGAGRILGLAVSPITKVLFGLNAEEAAVFLISATAGYPVGAKLLNSLYLDGKISRAKALKMLCFSVNAGPAFIIATVGEGFLKCRGDGYRLLICHIISAFILAAAVRFLPDRLFARGSGIKKQTSQLNEKSAISDIFVLSVLEAGKTMLNVTIFVVFFAGIGGGLSALNFGGADLLRALLEVTAGLSQISRRELYFAAFLLGFGGISVIFQVISSAASLKPKLTVVLCSRLCHGGLSYISAVIFEALFPRNLAAGSFNLQPDNAALHTSPAAALSLILLLIVILWFLGNTSNVIKSFSLR